MADQKNTPNNDQNLPSLPGQENSYDVVLENIQGPKENGTTPAPNVEPVPSAQRRIIFDTVEPKVVEKEKSDKEWRTIAQGVVLILFLALIFIGIVFAIRSVPKAITSIKALFVSSTTSTSTPKTATSTKPTQGVNLVASQTSTSTTTPVRATGTPRPDLSVKIISINNVGGETRVRFNVQNVGNATSGSWTFSAKLPSTETPIYYSQVQNPITPKSGVIYTLGFPMTGGRGSTIEIKIFPKTGDAKTSNNVAAYLLY